MADKNLRNAFDIDLPEDDPDLQELIALKTIKSAISKKKKALKDKNFEVHHPAVALLKRELESRDRMKEAQMITLKEKEQKESVPEPKAQPDPIPPKEQPEPIPEKKDWTSMDWTASKKGRSPAPDPRPSIKKTDRSGRWLL